MNITIDQFKQGVMRFIDEDIAPKASSMTKFILYFFAPAVPKMIEEYAHQMIDIDSDHDLISTDGHIHLDTVYERARHALSKAGGLTIPKINYVVDMDDLDKLYKILNSM